MFHGIPVLCSIWLRSIQLFYSFCNQEHVQCELQNMLYISRFINVITNQNFLLLSPKHAHILFSQGYTSALHSQGLRKIIRGRPHYYQWHAFVLFLRLCFLHVCLCGKCIFVLMSGKKVCLMTLDAPLKYQIHHSSCVVNHHGDMEQLNLCLSQA